MAINKKCTVCGKEFEAKNEKGTYCSNSCRVKAYRIRTKEEKQELEKNISEEYAEELSFFRMRMNEMYNDVHKPQNEMVTVTKYLYSFAEKIARIPDFQETRNIKNDIKDLSESFEKKIEKLKVSFEEKIERNDNNIRTIGLKINEFAYEINRINDNNAVNNSRADMIDKILDSDMIPDIVDKFVKRKPNTTE
jgi:phenylalanyl-tRNA synthetase alpha subunit